VTLFRRRLLLLTYAAVLHGGALYAQGTTQLSTTGTVILPYDRKWTFVGEIAPSRVVDGTPEWQELSFNLGAERNVLRGLDLLGYGYVYFTNQVEDLNTTELRIRLGAQPFWRPMPRLFLQGRAAFENRWIHYQTQGWDYTARVRFRALGRFTVRRSNEFQPGAIFLRADIEGYAPLGDKATERYFDKVGVRTGAGYRFGRRDLGELYLVRRASEMTFLPERDNSDWIIEFKYAHILARPTPARPSSSP